MGGEGLESVNIEGCFEEFSYKGEQRNEAVDVPVCGYVYVVIKICSNQGKSSSWLVSMLMAMGNDLLKRDHIGD